MAIFSSKDWTTGKSDKIRAAVGRRMTLGRDATNNEVGDLIDDYLRKLVRQFEVQDAVATAEAGVAEI